MMAMTTNNSINVKAERDCGVLIWHHWLADSNNGISYTYSLR